MKSTLYLFTLSILVLASCSSREKTKADSIQLGQTVNEQGDTLLSGLSGASSFEDLNTVPESVLFTGNTSHRLVTVYKEKVSRDGKYRYVDGDYYHTRYWDNDSINNWHRHWMPGLEAVYGVNMYNISHFNIDSLGKNYLFEAPVIVKTLYYPAFLQDTLYEKPVKRNYYLVSVYDEDTDKDTLISYRDLRRFYVFDIDGKNPQPLVPLDYSVLRSKYDSRNDLMYVYARKDENGNGAREQDEPIHIFSVSLSQPGPGKRVY